jgi:hypothetical protein
MTTLWQLPAQPTQIRDVTLLIEPLQRCTLSIAWEDDAQQLVGARLIFEGVESFRVTHRSAVTDAIRSRGMDQLVDAGGTQWLAEVAGAAKAYWGLFRPPAPLRHLSVAFADRSCYEFLCADIQVQSAR